MQARASFAADFSRLVGPALAAMCSTEALLVALDLVRFYEAESRIIRHALNRGAGHLTDHEFADLRRIISDTLLQATLDFEPTIAAAAERGRRLSKVLQHG